MTVGSGSKTTRRSVLTAGGCALAPLLLASRALEAAPSYVIRAAPRFYPRVDLVPELSLAGKVAVITGASRGIGLATGLALQALGVQVIGTSRTPAAYPSHPFPLLALDLADPASIQSFATAVQARAEVQAIGGIDILINNAGRFALGGVLPTDPGTYFAGLQLAQATLYGGHVAVTGALLQAVAARAFTGYGRILFTVSIAAYGVGGSEPGTSFYHAYASAKRGLLAYANSLRGLLDATGLGVRVSTVNPFTVATALASGTRPIFLQPSDAEGNAPDDPNFQAFLDVMRGALAGGLPPSFVAQAFVQLLSAAQPEPNVAAGAADGSNALAGQNEFVLSTSAAEMAQSALPWVTSPPGRSR